jgi:hypothetical protein
MSRICGESCPIAIAIRHTDEIVAGINESDFGVVPGLPTRAENVERWASTSYDADVADQNCERSCRVLRAMIYGHTVGGTGTEVLRALPHFGQEI